MAAEQEVRGRTRGGGGTTPLCQEKGVEPGGDYLPCRLTVYEHLQLEFCPRQGKDTLGQDGKKRDTSFGPEHRRRISHPLYKKRRRHPFDRQERQQPHLREISEKHKGLCRAR